MHDAHNDDLVCVLYRTKQLQCGPVLMIGRDGRYTHLQVELWYSLVTQEPKTAWHSNAASTIFFCSTTLPVEVTVRRSEAKHPTMTSGLGPFAFISELVKERSFPLSAMFSPLAMAGPPGKVLLLCACLLATPWLPCVKPFQGSNSLHARHQQVSHHPHASLLSYRSTLNRESGTRLLQSTTSSDSPSPDSMRLSEITSELKTRGIPYQVCFDRESLVKRLVEAREAPPQNGDNDNVASGEADGGQTEQSSSDGGPSEDSGNAEGSTGPSGVDPESASSQQDENSQESNGSEQIPIEKLEELRSKRVRELREECAQRQIRWGSFVEKEELVQAIWNDMQQGLSFSATGLIRPGKVADLTGDELENEIDTTKAKTPILIDVYATWYEKRGSR